jgi:mannosyl-oligosaccharide alpha-1,2-mannosidase
LTDVNAVNGGNRYDNQESFLFAEVMKYAYLTHAPGMGPISIVDEDEANESRG